MHDLSLAENTIVESPSCCAFSSAMCCVLESLILWMSEYLDINYQISLHSISNKLTKSIKNYFTALFSLQFVELCEDSGGFISLILLNFLH